MHISCKHIIPALLLLCSSSLVKAQIGIPGISTGNTLTDSITKIEMHLNAFGVESNHIPNVDAYIDLKNDSNYCSKTFDDPSLKSSFYSLTKTEIKKLVTILRNSKWHQLKSKYSVDATDQPTSTLIIYTNSRTYEVTDHGLKGEDPLPELYRIVYKLW